MTGMFFVVSDYMDEGNPLYLSWDMAREMKDGRDVHRVARA